jgi:hypothetical protein
MDSYNLDTPGLKAALWYVRLIPGKMLGSTAVAGKQDLPPRSFLADLRNYGSAYKITFSLSALQRCMGRLPTIHGVHNSI